LRHVQSEYPNNTIPGRDLADIAASFQKSVVAALLQKVEWALDEFDVKSISLVGGVAANLYLRENLQNLAEQYSLKVVIPDLEFCGDNGAMIANRAGMIHFDESDNYLTANAFASLPAGVFKEPS
jgi:N6-L-threonylcarbamoyladenine synthase